MSAMNNAARPELENYRQLVSRVDDLCRSITERYVSELACRKGCADCCRHISLFPVEVAVVREALLALPPNELRALQDRAGSVGPADACPLLDESGACRVYAARPIICRTHGLPVMTCLDGQRRVDACPANFSGCTSLPGSAVIDVDRINAALAAINRLFVAATGGAGAAGERLSMAAIILSTAD
ncbi:YkgJ family cysteine cluster protein [Desulfuromonas sp. CSMB_57]|uniref:YkgJ family cysteine cluster protein n=1 Tax=Desulfuromonas sp. CSMB_57 TaxID=2807629 RepID=UPI001CD721BC|nr:YkgJ family cysteine cluster protein [Desulfuromonas sp. CSMB_57]